MFIYYYICQRSGLSGVAGLTVQRSYSVSGPTARRAVNGYAIISVCKITKKN